MTLQLKNAQKAIRALANPAKAKFLLRFFKTGPGEYSEGDQFLGLTVPQTRSLVREFRDLPLADCIKLLKSPFHEERLMALLILGEQFGRHQKQDNEAAQKKIYDLYLAHTKHVNNWDLVDSSASYIVGAYLFNRDRKILDRLAKSKDLWERRIAIVATHYFIRKNDLKYTFRISEALLGDKHDLIHKASGWMLREAGKKDLAPLEAFLEKHAYKMPRTMLRYSIERMTPQKKKHYMGFGKD